MAITIRSISAVRSIIPFIAQANEGYYFVRHGWGYRLIIPTFVGAVLECGCALDIYMSGDKVISIDESTYDVDRDGYWHWTSRGEVYTA